MINKNFPMLCVKEVFDNMNTREICKDENEFLCKYFLTNTPAYPV